MNELPSGPSQAIALAGYFSLSFGLMFAIAIANRHTLSPVTSRRLPAVATLTGAISLAGMALLLHTVTLLTAAAQIAVFSILLWGPLNLARTVPEGHTSIAVSAVMIIVGTLCLKVFTYVR